MKKSFLLFMFLLTLVSCKSITINTSMYEINDFKCEEVIDNYYYDILDTYDDYENNLNYENINKYSKEYFNNSSLIIIYVRDSTNNNKYSLKKSIKYNDKLEIILERVSQGLSQVFSTVSYCVEIDSKNITTVEIIKE